MTNTLTKSNAREVQTARLHLRLGNAAGYASTMANLHRAASKPQQDAIWLEIQRDRTEHSFKRVPSIFSTRDKPSYSLVAADPIYADLVELEFVA